MKLYLSALLCLCFLLKGISEESCLYLTSQEDVVEKFIEKIQAEKEKIFLASMRLSNREILEALIQAHHRNVQVEVLVDSSFVSKKSCLQKLTKEGIAVWVWQDGRKRMKHSFCVFGSDLSWIGSYGFGASHRESVLLLKNEKVAKELFEEFEKMKEKGSTYLPLHIQQKRVNS